MTSRLSLILGGIIDILFGIFLLFYPAATIGFLLLVFGIYAVLYGVALVVGALSGDGSSSYRWWLAIGGALSFFAGLLALFYQAATAIILVYFIAFRAVFVGIFELITSIQMRKVIEGEFLLGLVGVLNILFGLFIIFFPIAATTTIVLVLAWYSILIGIILLFRGLFLRPREV